MIQGDEDESGASAMLLNQAEFMAQKLKNRHKLPSINIKKNLNLTLETDQSNIIGGISNGTRNGLNNQSLNIMSGDPLETANVPNISIEMPFSTSNLSPIQGES